VLVEHWGAFTGFWSREDSVSLAELGERGFYVPVEYPAWFARSLGAEPASHYAVDELVTRLNAEPGSLALLPLAAADPRLRSVSVGGVNLLQGGTQSDLRLGERLGLDWDD